MDVTFHLINGLCFGIQYVSPDEELPNPMVVVEFAFFRWIFEFIQKE